MTGHEKKGYEQISEPWLVERAREILKAQGRLVEVDAETMDPDELREKVENVARRRYMAEAGLSITQERGDKESGASRRQILDEVMK